MEDDEFIVEVGEPTSFQEEISELLLRYGITDFVASYAGKSGEIKATIFGDENRQLILSDKLYRYIRGMLGGR